ncbi:MAG: DUF58 domain-containing protein [Actinomycetota bacterium]
MALLGVLAPVLLIWPGTPSWRLLVVLNALGLGVIVADALRAGGPRSVSVERELPGVVTVDRPVALRWHVRGAAGRTLRLRLADDLVPSLGADRRAEVVLAPDATAVVETELVPGRRGRFALDRIACRTTGPLGLGQRQFELLVHDELRVMPRFRSHRATEMRLRRGRLPLVGTWTTASRGNATEFEQLRDYTIDDETRRIDWAATARAAGPIVRTFRAERDRNVGVVLDTGRAMALDVGGASRLEQAMDAAMSIAAVAAGAGDRISLLAADVELRASLAAARRTDQVARVADAVHDLDAELVETDHLAAVTHLLERAQRRSLVILLTDLVDRGRPDGLVAAARHAVRHQVVVVGAVADPAVRRWATAVPTSPIEVHRRAVAITELERRRAVADQLRALGVVVVDEPPSRLGVRIADTYLAVRTTRF